MSEQSKKNVASEMDDVAVYALERDNQIVGVPFFATKVSLQGFVNQMLDALPFSYALDLMKSGFVKRFGKIRKLAVFNVLTGEFKNLDPVYVPWSFFDMYLDILKAFCNLRKEDLPDENKHDVDQDGFGKIDLPC